mmetsp:Transcript_20367/g.2722  ORF Transcript_20367/g.2722 Transcript_20367/m.2722 type:complete len:124 (-) Transcript_20367:130-501(-)
MIFLRILNEINTSHLSISPFFSIHRPRVIHTQNIVIFLGKSDKIEVKLFLIEVTIIITEEFGIFIPNISEIYNILVIRIFFHEIPIRACLFTYVSPFQFFFYFSLIFNLNNLIEFNFITNLIR